MEVRIEGVLVQEHVEPAARTVLQFPLVCALRLASAPQLLNRIFDRHFYYGFHNQFKLLDPVHAARSLLQLLM